MKKIFFITGLLVTIAWQGMSQTVMTLRQCVETGIANNFDVLQSQLQAESDKANWKQARMNMLPDLNASAGHNYNQGRSIDPYSNAPVTQSFNSSSYGVSSNVILFNGLSVLNNIKQSSLSYKASSMELQQEKDNLTINIILAYLQVLSNTDQVEQAKNQLELTGKQVERLEILNKEGAVRPITLSDLKGQYSGDQLSIINAQNLLESAKVNLSRLMNVPYNKDLALEKIQPESFAVAYDQQPDAIYETALKEFALIKAVDLRRQSAGKGVKVARGQLFPTLSFGANAFTNYVSVAQQSQFVNTTYVPTTDSAVVNGLKYPVFSYQNNFTPPSTISYKDQLDNNFSTSYGFNLRIPIFNALSQRNRVKQAKIRYESAEITASSARTRLSLDIEQAYVNMTSASERYKALMAQVESYQQSFNSAGVLFQQGVGTSIDYLTAKNNLDRANISLIIARYDLVLRTKVLDYYQGKQLW